MTDPRVSVLLPVYNGMPHLPAAAESMLTQTFTGLELLLVDDGSTDGSGDVLDAFAARDPRVRVLRHGSGANRGLVASLNLGLAEARGEYVARMDADDRSYPERIARQVAYLDAHPTVGALGTRADSFDGTDWSMWGAYTTNELIRWHLLFTTPMVHPSVTMRRSMAESVGGYNGAYPHLEDYKFFYDLSRRTELANLAEPLIYFNRATTTNVSTRHRRVQFETCLAIHREIFRGAEIPLPEPHMALVSGCLFSTPEETEQIYGPLCVADVDAAGRTMHRLARAFVRRERPSAETRAEIGASLRWRGSQLADYATSRGLLSHLAMRAVRLSWDVPGATGRAVRRLAPR